MCMCSLNWKHNYLKFKVTKYEYTDEIIIILSIMKICSKVKSEILRCKNNVNILCRYEKQIFKQFCN